MTGTILRGMSYESKPVNDPDQSATFVLGSMTYLREIRKSHLEQLDEACRVVEPPGPLLRNNGSRIDPSKPIRQCEEWVGEVKENFLEALEVAE